MGWLRGISISKRLYLGFGGLFVFLMLAVLLTARIQTLQMSHAAEQRELNSHFQGIMNQIEAQRQLSIVLSEAVAAMPLAQEMFVREDREGLAELFVEVFQKLKHEHGLSQLQFHSPPAVSMLRLHLLDRYGDDLASFRETVVVANRDRKSVGGLEFGVAGLGLRGVAPIQVDGRHVGSIEFGFSFGQSFFQSVKERSGVDVALYTVRDAKVETFASTFRDAGSFFSEEQARRIARNDQQVMLQGELDGVPVSVLGRAVTDFSGNPLGVLEIAMDRSIYESYIAGFRAALISISVIAVIVGTLVAYVISQSVLTALNQVRSVTENLAVGDGDLTVRLPEQGSDELACLSNNINVFLAKTEGIITNVRASTEGVASSSEQLSSSSNEMSVGMNMQAQAITQISTAVSEMAETVNVVARNMSEVLGSSQNALQVARAGGDTVGQSVQEMTTIASEVDRTAHSARELEEKSRRVEEVIQVINDIADQTNLLALNAAIEAARAGDAGRGFAVVADEVRKLAERSTQSTGEIIGIVKTIQTGVNTVTNALAKVNEKVQNGAQLSEQTSGAFASILREMDALMHLIEDNVAAIEEMSKTTDHINDDIQSISSASEETAKASEEVSFAAGDLARLAAEVRQHISAFRTASSSEGGANDIKRIALYDSSRK